jgi:DNA-binding MarR family transcriptional regulator
MLIEQEDQQLFEMIQRFRSLNLLATLPLPRQDYMVLYTVDCLQKEHPDACTVSMITKKMRIPQPAVSRTLRNLENGGYLQREVCRSDRRNTYVLLTDAGKKAVQDAGQVLMEFHNGIKKRFTQEESDQLMSLLQRLYEAASEQLEEMKKGAVKPDGKTL